MELVADEVFRVPDAREMGIVVIRLVAAALLGGLLGAERESGGKPAGLRTHMLVGLGAALFVIAPLQMGMVEADVSRIIQGVAAGIGFIGAGTILKLTDRQEIQGLTTAASVWLTAAIGVAAAVAPLWVPVLWATCAWVILYALGKVENRIGRRSPPRGTV
jgi:putative Mg2+ transporter-C (MgtC) family protein